MITVIVPTYNNEDTIYDCLESVQTQTYKDWKILIINDASTDNTLNEINKFKLDFNIPDEQLAIITNEENLGVGKSRIIGVNNTTTEFLTFLDSDDIILSTYLDTSIMLQQKCDADVVYTSTTIFLDEEHYKDLPVPNCIMNGRQSVYLHIKSLKKWLTGKLFRTSLMKTVPMSPNRITEDVNTLFYSCYLAKKVISAEYSGYVHIYREGSLVGFGEEGKSHFYYYCKSTLVDIELMDFIIKKEDWEIFKDLARIPYMNFKRHCNLIKTGETKKEDVKQNLFLWDYIKIWFNDNKQILEKHCS